MYSCQGVCIAVKGHLKLLRAMDSFQGVCIAVTVYV